MRACFGGDKAQFSDYKAAAAAVGFHGWSSYACTATKVIRPCVNLPITHSLVVWTEKWFVRPEKEWPFQSWNILTWGYCKCSLCCNLLPCSSPMDVFLLKLCCALPIQNFHPAGYQIVLLEFMCVESFSAVFLKKKSFSAEDEKKKEGTLYFKRSPMDCVVVGSSGPHRLNSARPTENGTPWAVGGPSGPGGPVRRRT